MLPIDARALDVICSNCFSLVKVSDVDSHSQKCALEVNENNKKQIIEKPSVAPGALPRGTDFSCNFRSECLSEDGTYVPPGESNPAQDAEDELEELNERLFKIHGALQD